MKLSVLVPIYNEVNTLLEVVKKVSNVGVDKEIILVDDFSTDGTRQLLEKEFGRGKGNIKVFYHEKNMGKGAAVRTALKQAKGDFCIIQDADLEYKPEEYIKLVEYAQANNAPAVYGSRFLDTWKSTSLLHYAVNAFFTNLTNVFFGLNLTDMETCYKMIKTDIFKNLNLKSNKFELEAEITVRLIKKGYEIKELPISYRGRSYHEGKKIGWKDAFQTLWVILAMRLSREN